MKSILPSTWKVPELFKSRLGEIAGRQRALTADGHLLLVLHEPPKPGDAHRNGRLFWRDSAGEWKSNSLGNGIQAIRNHLAEYAERIDKLEDQLQVAASADDYFQLLRASAPIHRTSRNMHATLQKARESMPDDRDLILFRDLAGDIERAAELVHADSKNGLEFTSARQSEEQTRRIYQMTVSAHRLNLLAAIFFPIATLSSIFSMNLVQVLEAEAETWRFWSVLGIGIASGLFLALVIAKRPAPLSSPEDKRKIRRR